MENRENTIQNLLSCVVDGIRDKKGKKLTVLDMRKLDDAVCDYMVIAEGNTPTQVEALMESVESKAKTLLKERPNYVHVGSGEWVALDYMDIIVHLFVPALRGYYNIEQLWADAEQEILPDEE